MQNHRCTTSGKGVTGNNQKDQVINEMASRNIIPGCQSMRSLRLRGLSPEFGLLKNSRKRTKMPTEQEAKPAVVTPSLQQWRSPSTFRGAPGEDPLKWLKSTIE
ncbi:hypothetical protein TNCV_1349271 [Trichonephila clavipes]|nr:hypothetical protein TNCV_1349271 [Trichonephila clavipes]